MYVQWVMGSYNLWLTALWYLIRIAKNAPLGVLRARICVLRKTCGTVRAVDVCGAFPRRIRAPRRLYPRKAGFGIWSQFTLATMQNTWQKIKNWFDFQQSNFTADFRYLFLLRAQFHWGSASSIFVLSKYEMATMSTHPKTANTTLTQFHQQTIYIIIPKTKKATEYFPDEHH